METVLTGITTTGAPHIGNYVGAIRPAIAASTDPNTRSFLFLADYHSLVKGRDPEAMSQSTLEIAAAWLACGLDPDRVVFYRQSDVPEIMELTWVLTCMTAKGLMNRAHAYKAAVAENDAKGDRDPDQGIMMGLFCYPILMAADILAYFDRPGTSNGPTEAMSGCLEHLRGSALGFRNLTNYIARALLEAGGFRPRLHPGFG